MESDLVAAIKPLCPNVFPDVADPLPAPPYVVYQHIGGATWRYLDNSPANARNTMVQLGVWAATKAQALTLVRQIEDVLCAAAAFTARPMGEPIAQAEPELQRYGLLQDFSITAPR